MDKIVCVLLLVICVTTVKGFWPWRSPQTVCYHNDGIGCFTTESPYDSFGGYLPESPAHIQVEFLLYNRANSITPRAVTRDTSSIQQSEFDGTKKTVFIIHGYTDSAHSEWVVNMIHALLSEEDINVFAVNWRNGADNTNYVRAACNTQVVGALLAQFLTRLLTIGQTQPDTIHLIGHSLGSHVAGFAGSRVYGIGRITGLDPAGPAFENSDPVARLDPSDALYVDAIHTDRDSLMRLGFGINRPVGDADFYPNGGNNQPGCFHGSAFLMNLIYSRFSGFRSGLVCSHMRVIDLFTESITSDCSFQAYPCDSMADYVAGRCSSCGSGCSRMGYHSNEGHPHGIFYLSTYASAPFCIV